MKELKERVADELLPRAFTIRSNVWTWIDPVNGWLVVDAASPAKADDVIKLLLKAVDRMPLESLRVQRSPVAVMTAWLETDEAPDGFTVDQDTELRATGESRAAVRYVKHALEAGRHPPPHRRRQAVHAPGDDVERQDLVRADRIAGDQGHQAAGRDQGKRRVTRNDEERFDNDMMLMTGELAKMMADVVEALGGEAKA